MGKERGIGEENRGKTLKFLDPAAAHLWCIAASSRHLFPHATYIRSGLLSVAAYSSVMSGFRVCYTAGSIGGGAGNFYGGC